MIVPESGAAPARPVLVLAERRGYDGRLCRSTFALLTLARRLGVPAAVLDGVADAASVAELGRFGAGTVYVVTVPGVDEFPIATRVEALAALAGRDRPMAILAAAGGVWHEVAARVAVRLDARFDDVIDVRAAGAGQAVVHPAPVESRVVGDIAVCAVRTDAVEPRESPVASTLREAAVPTPDRRRGARLVSRLRAAAAPRPELTAAPVIVAGGRGIGSRRSFELVHQLADALGGVAGGTHTAVELGWCDRDARIDIVGHVVHPQLYIALGVSGSVRHRAAIPDAGTVLAVDNDPAAPIFSIADLAVVGDVHQVVPELLMEIRRRRSTVTPRSATLRRNR